MPAETHLHKHRHSGCRGGRLRVVLTKNRTPGSHGSPLARTRSAATTTRAELVRALRVLLGARKQDTAVPRVLRLLVLFSFRR